MGFLLGDEHILGFDDWVTGGLSLLCFHCDWSPEDGGTGLAWKNKNLRIYDLCPEVLKLRDIIPGRLMDRFAVGLTLGRRTAIADKGINAILEFYWWVSLEGSPSAGK